MDQRTLAGGILYAAKSLDGGFPKGEQWTTPLKVSGVVAEVTSRDDAAL